MQNRGKDTPAALVLAGAVAKGAFEAGVTSELAASGMVFDRFVGTSAGALNATLLAAGAAAGRFEYAARKLEALWRDRATIRTFLRPTLSPGGFSSTKAVESLIVDAIEDVVRGADASPAGHRTKLTLVTTDIRGTLDEGELTHEDEYELDERALLDQARWKDIAAIAAASAAFPYLFAPPRLRNAGGEESQHVDGGVVNNAPLSYAIERDERKRGRNSIVVVSAEPKSRPPRRTLWGPTLGVRLVEILINERIGRDLVVARKRNEKRRILIDALKDTGRDAEAFADHLGFRELDILPIYPREPLSGGAFGGFFWKPSRAKQIHDGKVAARAALHERKEPFPKPVRLTSRNDHLS